MVIHVYNSYFWKITSNLLSLPHSNSLCCVSKHRLCSTARKWSSVVSHRPHPHHLPSGLSMVLPLSYSNKHLQTSAIELNSIHKKSLLLVRSPFSRVAVIPTREFSVSSSYLKTGSFWYKIFGKKLSESRLIRSGYNLYSEISKETDILYFFKVLSLEDTFFSWFVVIQLQVWLVSVRLMAEEDGGKTARDALISAMWDDTQAKLKDLGVRSYNKKTDLEEMNSHFQSALVSYDEGLLGSDKELAGALWRRLVRRDVRDLEFGDAGKDSDEDEDQDDLSDNESSLDYILEPTADPRCLEAMVSYIRKQVELLDNVDRETLLIKAKLPWCKPELPERF